MDNVTTVKRARSRARSRGFEGPVDSRRTLVCYYDAPSDNVFLPERGLLDLFYCFWPNVRRLFRRITRKGLLAPVAKRLRSLPRRASKSTQPYAISSYNLSKSFVGRENVCVCARARVRCIDEKPKNVDCKSEKRARKIRLAKTLKSLTIARRARSKATSARLETELSRFK